MESPQEYGTKVLRSAFPIEFSKSFVKIDLGPGIQKVIIDGTIGNDVAVEIESRTPKQVRGALLDLMLHDYPRKLLIIMAVHCKSETVQQAQHAWRKLRGTNLEIEVVEMIGYRNNQHFSTDKFKLPLQDFDLARFRLNTRGSCFSDVVTR